MLFSELMKKKQLKATPPECDTELTLATCPDIVKVAKGFVSMVMSSPSEEEAVKATSALSKHLPPSSTSKSDLLLVGLLTECFAKLPACPLVSLPSLTTQLLSISHALRVDQKGHPSAPQANPALSCGASDGRSRLRPLRDCLEADFQNSSSSSDDEDAKPSAAWEIGQFRRFS